MVRPLDESRGSSPLRGHGTWLVCEVALGMVTQVHEYSCIFKFWPRTSGYIYTYLRIFFRTCKYASPEYSKYFRSTKNLYVCDRFLEQIQHILCTPVTLAPRWQVGFDLVS